MRYIFMFQFSLHPDEQVKYIGKTGIPTQNVLAVCDFGMWSHMYPRVKWDLRMTQVCYTMQSMWMKNSSHILLKVI
jgi:hypothetical protein